MTDMGKRLAQRAGAMGFTFVTPSARVVHKLHVLEDGARLDDPDVMPLTMCGQPICPHDLWVKVERRDGDRLCYDCADEAGLIQTVKMPETWSVLPRHT